MVLSGAADQEEEDDSAEGEVAPSVADVNINEGLRAMVEEDAALGELVGDGSAADDEDEEEEASPTSPLGVVSASEDDVDDDEDEAVEEDVLLTSAAPSPVEDKKKSIDVISTSPSASHSPSSLR